MNVDGRDVMLNERESARWVDTGRFERIPEGDDEDAEYCALRDRMKANGDEAFYKACCPVPHSALISDRCGSGASPEPKQNTLP